MKIRRGGRTAKNWSDEAIEGKLWVRPGAVLLKFSLSVSSGLTDVEAEFDPSEFGAMLKAFDRADAAATDRAIEEFFFARAVARKAAPPKVAGFQTMPAHVS